MVSVAGTSGKFVAAALLALALVILLLSLPANSGGKPPPTTTVNATSSRAPSGGMYGPANETPSVRQVYPNTTQNTFACVSSNDCAIVHTQLCFNNLASQQACINKLYVGAYQPYYGNFLRGGGGGGVVCPQFLVSANVTCTCMIQGCTMVYKPS